MDTKNQSFALIANVNSIITSYFERYELAAAGYAPITATTLMWCITTNWIYGFRAVYQARFVTKNHIDEAIRQNNDEMIRTLCQDFVLDYDLMFQIAQKKPEMLTTKMESYTDYNLAVINAAGMTGNLELALRSKIDKTTEYNLSIPIMYEQIDILALHLTSDNLDSCMIKACTHGKLSSMKCIHEHPDYKHNSAALMECITYSELAAFKLYSSWFPSDIHEIFITAVHCRNDTIAIMLWNKYPEHRRWMKQVTYTDLKWRLL